MWFSSCTGANDVLNFCITINQALSADILRNPATYNICLIIYLIKFPIFAVCSCYSSRDFVYLVRHVLCVTSKQLTTTSPSTRWRPT